jgi:hypothetical protein
MDDFVPQVRVMHERLPERLFGNLVVGQPRVRLQRSTFTAFEVEVLWRFLILGEERRQRLLDNDFARHLRNDDGKLMSKLVLATREEVLRQT